MRQESASGWQVPQEFASWFDWDFGGANTKLLALYERGKAMQWNAVDRIDWNQDLDLENPFLLPPESMPLTLAPFYGRMSRMEQIELVREYQLWTTSQFLHGEQGAMICAAKTVQQVPDLDAKLYAATQVVDEARHVEVYRRLIGKFGSASPISPAMQTLLGQILRDARWDITYLGMQVVIEGLALAAFARIRDAAQNPLAAAVNAYVMEDEARHVAFGSLALRDYYPALTEAERAEREEFLIEACVLMRNRFDSTELWQRLGLPMDECLAFMRADPQAAKARNGVFCRIVPTIKAIGLWTPRVRRACAMMGIIHFADSDLDETVADDERIAREIDARRGYVQAVVARADGISSPGAPADAVSGPPRA